MLRGIALNLMAGLCLYEDNWGEAVALLERALDEADDDPTLLVNTLMSLAFGQRMIEKFDESLANARKAVAAAEELGTPALISRALAMLVQLSFMYGHGVDEASLQRALELDDQDSGVLMPFRARRCPCSDPGLDGADGRSPHRAGGGPTLMLWNAAPNTT